MADKKFNITFDVDANITPVKNAISGLQSALSKINIPDSFKKGLTDTFTKLDNEIKNFESITSKGFTNLADVNKAERSFDKVTDLLSKLRTEASRIKNIDDLNKLLPKAVIDRTKKLRSEWDKLKAEIDSGFGKNAAIEKQNQELDRQKDKLTDLQEKYNKLASENKTMGSRRGVLAQSLADANKQATDLATKMEALEKVKGGKSSAEYKKLDGELKAVNSSISRMKTEYDGLDKKINENKTTMAGYSTQITSTKNTISQITTTIEQLKSAAQQTPEGLNKLREELANIKGVNLNEIPTDIDAIGREIEELNADQIKQLTQSIDGLTPELKKADDAARDMGSGLQTASDQARELTAREKEIEQLANRVKYFFSIGNTVQLFKRAVKSAINTVKELDEVMTQAAVVTKFDVSGMWAQLPEYTKRANELGVTVKGVYEASTLYYQQGLETEQVIGVTNETLKMAKIAGLDYATATNYMTSALRGFNMEVNELSAQKVNDIYSQLAAKTASNVEEISVAMSKVAPLAHNAGMEIETTAAMLAQMIEKTREAPETLGTAMKTVIARFQELKKDPALIEPVDGEMVDANKVETALNTIGVALRDTSGQFRQLDEVFLEISQKWDTLDVNTQRYIATIAAGSRQQSRFIAMMADYERTMNLVNLANNSTGASTAQFEKTQASLATALNRLKNAWDQFAMGLANNEVIKKVIDLITGFINIVNKAIDKLSGGSSLIKSILNLGALLGGIKLARAAFNGFFGWLLKTSKITGLKAGTEAGAGFGAGITKALTSIKKLFQKGTWFGKGQIIDTSGVVKARTEMERLRTTIATTKNDLNQRPPNLFADLNTATKEYEASLNGVGKALTLTNAQQSASNSLQALGISEGIANAAAVGGLTEEKAKEYMATALANGASQEEAKQRLKNISLIYAQTAAEKKSNTVQQMGIAVRLRYIGALLFGTRAAREDALSKLGMATADEAATGAQWSLNAAIAACPIGWILAGIAALIAILVIFIKVAQNNSLEKRMERAAELTKEAKEAADSAKQAYEDLLSDKSEYSDLQDRLEDLTYGTLEWKEALIEANQQVLELIKTYPQLTKYLVKGAYGQLQISQEGWNHLTTSSRKAVENTAGGVTAAQINQINLQNEAALDKLGKTIREQFGVAATYQASGWLQASKQLGLNTEETENGLISILESFDDNADGVEKAKLALIEYNQVLAENELQARKTAQAYLTSALDVDVAAELGNEVSENITNAFATQFLESSKAITAKSLSDIENHQFEDIAKQYTFELAKLGKNAATLNKNATEDIVALYAAMSGKDYEELREKYKKNAGDSLRPLIANMINSQNIVEGQNEFAKQFLNLSEKAADAINLAMSEGASYISGQVLDENSLKAIYNANEQVYSTIYTTFDEFSKAYNSAITNGQREISEYSTKLANLGFNIDEEAFGKNLSASAIKGLTNKLVEVFSTTGLGAAEELYEEVNEITSKLNPDEANEFARALNGIDWKNIDSVETLSEVIDTLGSVPSLAISEIDSLEQQIIELARSAKTVDLEKLTDQVHSLSKVSLEISQGKQGRDFSEETKNKLVEYKVAKATDFRYNIETDSYTYIGPMEKLTTAIQENTAAITGQTKEQLQKNIDVGESAKAVLGNQGRYKQQAYGNYREFLLEQHVPEEYLPMALASMETQISNQAAISMLEDFIAQTPEQEIISKERLDEIAKMVNPQDQKSALDEVVKVLNKEKNSITTYQNDLDTITNDEAVSNYMAEYYNNLSELSRLAFTDESAADALKMIAYNAGLADEAVNSLNNSQLASIIQSRQNAEAYEMEAEEVDTYAEALLKTESAEIKTLDKAYRIAVANKRIERGLKDLIDNYEDWYDVLKDGLKSENYRGTEEYQTVLKGTKKAVQDLINSDSELHDQWLLNEETIEDLNKAIEGDEDALKRVVVKAVVDTSGIEDSEGQINTAIMNVLNDPSLKDIKVGTEVDIDTSSALSSLYSLLVAAGNTTSQIQQVFNSLGWKAEPQYEVIYDQFLGKEFTVFVGLKTEKLANTPFDAGFNLYGGSGSKSSGGGGKEAEWENPYDRLYNYLKEINGELRIREQLEKRYNRLIKLNVETGQSLKENIDNQIASLQEQNRLQKIVSEERLKDIKKIQAENEDLKRYGWFEEGIGVGGEVHINWEAINEVDAANDEELGKRIEDYISKMEEWADSRHEAIDAIEDNTDAIIELRETGKEEYKDLEDRALEAIINHQQKIIDEQEKLNDAITEANEALTDAISKNIEKIRQDRQNQETETSLAEKERRLAYLRQDTTGSNAVEIKKLEQDLEKERQNYTDSLIDQSLNDLKDQNDAAAKQREKQIELMQSQLDWQTETGYYVNQVTEMVQKMVAKGIIDETDPLYGLIQENEDYYKKTNASRQEWFEELKKTIAEAYVYQQNGGTDNGGGIMSNMLTVAEAQDLATFAGLEQQRNEKIRSQGLQDEWPETRMVQNYNNGKQQTIDTENSNYMLDMQNSAKSGNWAKVFEYAGMRDKKIGNDTTESFWEAFRMWYNAGQRWSQYASGGLADYTGPAWLDGTKTRPEMVLNARDTQNFLELRDLLSTMASSGTGNSSVGNFYCDIDINVGEVSSDYDVDRIAARIKQSIYEDTTYRNVNAINFLK